MAKPARIPLFISLSFCHDWVDFSKYIISLQVGTVSEKKNLLFIYLFIYLFI